MGKRVLAFTGALVLLVVVGKSYWTSPAANRTAYSQSQYCYAGGLTSCNAYFPAVPKQKRLVIEHVSLTVETGTAVKGVYFYGDSVQKLGLNLRDSKKRVYGADQPLHAYLQAGEQPSYLVNIESGVPKYSAATMAISGYLEDAR